MNARPERMTPAEKASQDEALAVGRGQPHRRGSADPTSDDRGTALRRFCADYRPNPLPIHCRQAGEEYRRAVIERLSAEEQRSKFLGKGDGVFEEMTDDQKRARKEKARKYVNDANAVLWALCPRGQLPSLPRRMELMCFDDFDPDEPDYAILRRGLGALARHWGFAPKSFAES